VAPPTAHAGITVLGVQEATRNETFAPGSEFSQKHGFVVERLAGELASRTGRSWEWCWSQSNPHVPGTPDVAEGGGNPLDDQAAARSNFPDEGDFREGVGILTSFHITASRFRRMLPRSYEAPACALNAGDPDPFCAPSAVFDSRQVLWAHVFTPRGPFDIFTTHIAHGITPLSDTTKLLQVQQAVAIVDEWATPDAWPDFVVGDFNSDPGSDRHVAMLEAGFTDTYRASRSPECTHPGDAGCSGDPPEGQEVYGETATRPMGRRIDYIFARPPATCGLAVPESHVIGNVAQFRPDLQPQRPWLWPSDHLGFVSAIRC
jgi:endonuclease/exonuclease/phosphatase family metal-dependent hydrolase